MTEFADAKARWLLEAHSRMARLLPHDVPRRHRLSADEFLTHYYAAGQPVVITGMMDDWPARSRWGLTYLRERFGERVVEVQAGREGVATYESSKDAHRRTMPLREFVRAVESNGPTNDFYLTAANDGVNRRALDGLWGDIMQVPEYLDTEQQGGFLWFGPAGTITPFHHDLTNNLIAQVIGRKRVLIVRACETPRMYNHHHCYSQVDGRAIDLGRFPLMADVPIAECVIAPGDMLFLPIGTWHFVEALDPSISLTFTNFRWGNHFTDGYPWQ